MKRAPVTLEGGSKAWWRREYQIGKARMCDGGCGAPLPIFDEAVKRYGSAGRWLCGPCFGDWPGLLNANA